MNKSNLSVLAGIIGLGLTKKMMGSRSLHLFERLGVDFKGGMIQIESTMTAEILVSPYGRLAYDLDLEEESGRSALVARVTDDLYYRIKALETIARDIRMYFQGREGITAGQFGEYIENRIGYSSHESEYIINMINNGYFKELYKLFKNLLFVSYPFNQYISEDEETEYICNFDFSFNIFNTESEIIEMMNTFLILIEYGDNIENAEGLNIIVDHNTKLPEKIRGYVLGPTSELRRF